MSGLSRTVIKWLQGLDLTFQVKNPKWDFSNGFLVAEILSKYYPKEVQMFSYITGQSLQTKMLNWSLIKKFIASKNLNIPNEYIDATMHSKEGGAVLFIESLYQVLTNKTLQKAQPTYEIDFTDWPYQQQLPAHARATAAQAIRNNIKNTEMHTDPNKQFIQQKIETIITSHSDRRKNDRIQDPKRFDIKPTLAERAIRKVPLKSQSESSKTIDSYEENEYTTFKSFGNTGLEESNDVVTEENRNYKEVAVRQDSYPSFTMETVN